VECKIGSDTNNNRVNWNPLKITQTLPGQHTRKARNQGSTEHSQTGLCTHTAESSDVKVQNISTWEISLHVPYTITTELYNTVYPGNEVSFRYVIANTLHKCDNKYDDDDDDDDDDNNNNNDNKDLYD
jgi:hypothetical protein